MKSHTLAFAAAGLALLASTQVFADTPAPAAGQFACQDSRLTIMNFYSRYKSVHNALWTEANKEHRAVVDLIDHWDLSSNTEQCAWDRFFFVDSVLYFSMDADLVPGLDAAGLREVHLKLLEVRNRFYSSWLDTIALGTTTGFAEWEKANVKDNGLRAFLDKGSEQFGFVEFVSGIFNPSPFWGESESEDAGAYVYRLLQAKTPFSAVMPELALDEAIRPEIASAVACVHEAVKKFECGQNLYDLALDCSAERDPGIALEVLGMFSAQRLYLIRDLKTWIEQRMTPEIANRVFDVFKKGSEIYFLTETIGNRCGPAGLFPKGTDTAQATVKNYHFWAEAVIASKLAEMGYSRGVAIDAALGPARLYKQSVAKVGVLYNWLLGAPSGAGAAGDVKQVLKEQQMGAVFGYDVGHAQLPIGTYRITTLPLPDLVKIREITGWYLVPGGMAITMLEIDPGVGASGARYTLKFADHSDYLRMKRVIEPRVQLTEKGFLVLY